MKKLVLIIAMLLLFSFTAQASSAIDLDRMTRAELESLKNEIAEALQRNHETNSEQRSKVLDVTKQATEEYFAQQETEISWAWINYEYTKEWNFYTLKTHIDYKDKAGNKQKPEVFSEVYETNNAFQLVYLKVGDAIIIDDRGLVPDDHRAETGINQATLSTTNPTNEPPMATAHNKTPAPTIMLSPAPTTDVSMYRILEVGSKGEDVLAARIRLYELGYFSKMPTQTDFTANMKDYVIEFQKANNLKTDGVLTPEVQGVLFSQNATAKPTPFIQLGKPKNIKVTVKNTTVTITWSAVPRATSYHVFRSTSQSGSFTKIASVTTLSYSETILQYGATFYYKVEAIADNNQSGQSNAVKAVLATAPPTPVPEPKYPLEDTGYGEHGTSYGYKWFKNNYKNTSSKYTIDGYTIAYYATDVYGDKIKAHGFGDYITYEIITQTIKPGKTKTTPKITAYGYEDAKRIYCAVSKIHLTNGTTINIPEKDREYWYWEY